MPLIIPDEALRAAGMSEAEAKLEIACKWFDTGKLTIGHAARLAGLSELEFEGQLNERGIPRYRYTEEMLEGDIESLEEAGAVVMPLLVISDTSPIRALHRLELLSICQALYGTVIIPAAVQAELRAPTATCPAIEIADYPAFEIKVPRSAEAIRLVPSDLDPGETQAIALAIELNADLLLIDERKGTQAARHLHLSTIGVIGVLLEAKRKGLIPEVMPLIDRLVKELKFFVTPALQKQIASLACEATPNSPA